MKPFRWLLAYVNLSLNLFYFPPKSSGFNCEAFVIYVQRAGKCFQGLLRKNYLLNLHHYWRKKYERIYYVCIDVKIKRSVIYTVSQKKTASFLNNSVKVKHWLIWLTLIIFGMH